MYTIFIDNQPLYVPLLANEGYGVISPKLTMELNKAGSLSFTLLPNNVQYDNIQKLKSIVTVYQDGIEVFRGRVLDDKKDFYKKKNVYCEGELAFLVDSVQRPYEYVAGVESLFNQFIATHNSQVEADKQFTVGNITVTDSNNYLRRSNIDHSTTWDAINDKLIDTHGGYIKSRLEDSIRYVDYLAEPGGISSQTIEFGVNLLDITEYISAKDVFTVLIPLGAKIEGSDDRIGISSVNNGLDYIENETGIALFGKVWKWEVWDDVTLPDNLLTKGQNFLQAGIEMAVSLELKAVDLHLIDVNVEEIKLGDSVRVISRPHNLDTYFVCSKLAIDMANPDKTQISLGKPLTAITEKQLQDVKNTAKRMEELYKRLNIESGE